MKIDPHGNNGSLFKIIGDQVVSVNGESVMCKSYAEVVGMIQKSGPTLNLVVLPKEHDILQQVTIFKFCYERSIM